MGDTFITDNTEEGKKEDEMKATEEQDDRLQTSNGSSTAANGIRRPLDLSLSCSLQTNGRTSRKRKQLDVLQDHDKTKSTAHEARTRLPTTSCFHGLGTVSSHYGNLLASAEFSNGADRSHLAEMSTKRFEGDLLTKRLFQIDVRAIRQLIASYRDAATLLIRTADELELKLKLFIYTHGRYEE
ncbi:hypothetical protein M513_02131 [Trichuris suis]|uniref:Uncharacterized protein n=1 Tax=Trichuris suis TaxID=68888 RepID=A0A085MI28_9BILA|nr:hypothetical protein M513_02131 [Trichuris suis]